MSMIRNRYSIPIVFAVLISALPAVERVACADPMRDHPEAEAGYWGSEGSSNTVGSVDYVFSIPTKGTHDFVPRVSFLGFSAESFQRTTDRFGVGISFSWTYFSDEANGTYQVDTATVTGKRFTAVDAFPLLVMGRYIPIVKNKITPFVGAGIGPMYGMQRGSIGVIGLNKTGWQLALAGEVGAAWFRPGKSTGLKIAARYVGGFGADSIPAISYLSFTIGVISPI